MSLGKLVQNFAILFCLFFALGMGAEARAEAIWKCTHLSTGESNFTYNPQRSSNYDCQPFKGNGRYSKYNGQQASAGHGKKGGKIRWKRGGGLLAQALSDESAAAYAKQMGREMRRNTNPFHRK